MENNRWVRAGPAVRKMFDEPVFQQIMGYTRKEKMYPVNRVWKKLLDTKLCDTFSALACPLASSRIGVPETDVRLYNKVSCYAGEMIAINSFIMLADDKVGQVKEIILAGGRAYATLNMFEVDMEERILRCPKLRRTGRHRMVSSTTINGPLNVQHNCILHSCRVIAASSRQEREDVVVEGQRSVIRHADNDDFLLNVYCHRTPWMEPYIKYNDKDFDVETACRALGAVPAAEPASAAPEEGAVGIVDADVVAQEAIHPGIAELGVGVDEELPNDDNPVDVQLGGHAASRAT